MKFIYKRHMFFWDKGGKDIMHKEYITKIFEEKPILSGKFH